MKDQRIKVRAAGLALAALIATGCATSNYSSGTDFNSASVARIQKGYTTEADLVRMFGQPYMKSPISATDEKWIYTYAEGSAKASYNLITSTVKTSGYQKTLDVLLSSGVVVNYTFTQGATPAAVGTSY
ncbi:hypothetical protein GCM10011348_46220 [Marinobacterium nitratireducens]|uniref:Lipoprotein SmpA/OmlA domain-containing protein n=1 Tax=Marinobacterium nitratireducens TaxID=518897 RepID=A0A917ZPW7_9GAMM|nr:hypothetical protein [Marinobacterium nitratireducens]GGO89148.1 hypothetical protein GCM10011348_46220 [Marinobacterium nitratireducens]